MTIVSFKWLSSLLLQCTCLIDQPEAQQTDKYQFAPRFERYCLEIEKSKVNTTPDEAPAGPSPAPSSSVSLITTYDSLFTTQGSSPPSIRSLAEENGRNGGRQDLELNYYQRRCTLLNSWNRDSRVPQGLCSPAGAGLVIISQL